MTRRPLAIGLAAAVAVIVVDQASKIAILRLFDVEEGCRRILDGVTLTPFLNIILTCNRGVSFGLFDTGSPLMPWLLIGIAAIVVLILLVLLARCRKGFTAWGYGLVIGGAVGNAVDRLRFGEVVDFVDFHVGDWHFATFNGADSAITLGVVLLLADSLFTGRESNK